MGGCREGLEGREDGGEEGGEVIWRAGVVSMDGRWSGGEVTG